MSCMRLLVPAAAALLIAAPTAVAQTVEAGVVWGRGEFNYGDDKLPGSRNVVGVEVCVGCDGRGVFVEYARWGEPRVDQDACQRYYDRTDCRTGYREADTLAGGIRFQGRPRRGVRLFADVGAALAHSRYQRSAVETSNHFGADLGVGATIRFGRLYTRAAGHVLILSGYYVGARMTVGMGWRF